MVSSVEQNVKLSQRATDLLEWVVDTETDSNRDPRGFYAEFESGGYKPWKPAEVAELVESGLVDAHPESDHFPTLQELKEEAMYDEEEEYDGVAFLFLTESGKEYAKANGLGEE